MDNVALVSWIFDAFSKRDMPDVTVCRGSPPTDEYSDAMKFKGRHSRDVTCGDLEAYPAAVFGFSPEAFCYYLPSILAAGIREGRRDLRVNESLITMLDGATDRALWRDFFVRRWCLLTVKECRAVQLWIYWLLEVDGDFLDIELSRAMDALEMLAGQAEPES